MEKIYFTITGTKYYYGKEFIKTNMKVKLIKEPRTIYIQHSLIKEK